MVSLDTWDVELLISKKLSQPNYGLSDTVIVTGFVISGILWFFYDICWTEMMSSCTVKSREVFDGKLSETQQIRMICLYTVKKFLCSTLIFLY